MTDEPAPAVSPVPVPAPKVPVDWNMLARWAGVASLAGAVLSLELTGHAPQGTFLNYVAVPGLTFLGLHTAAKNLT